MTKLERKYQANLKKKIKSRFKGCIILKNDCHSVQGFPDLTVYHNETFALLECKRSATAKHRPNQDYYVNNINNAGGFARFVYPENEEDVLKEMEGWFNEI